MLPIFAFWLETVKNETWTQNGWKFLFQIYPTILNPHRYTYHGYAFFMHMIENIKKLQCKGLPEVGFGTLLCKKKFNQFDNFWIKAILVLNSEQTKAANSANNNLQFWLFWFQLACVAEELFHKHSSNLSRNRIWGKFGNFEK